ncbi:hypothetical protein BHM03_00054757 [Ensete ventricosum]|nr:hypothetical protein BHM03_00054757 [Ensete ventricosum]
MGRVAHGLIARSLLRRNLAPPHSSSSSSSAAAVAAQRTVPIASSCGTASDVATCPRPRWRLFSLPVAPSRSVSVGLAGALSFSLTLVTTAGAKEPPSPELIPKDVVLYQYEACPFCNKVKGNFSMTERFTVKYAGAAIMYMVSKKLKKKYNITDERGSKPNLADLAVFGVLRPIRHLKAGKDMVENTKIGEWYQRMEIAVGESSRIAA